MSMRIDPIIISEDIVAVATKFDKICSFLDERSRRMWCAVEAESFGYGGITLVHKATGLSKTTIRNWYTQVGQEIYINGIKKIMITADCGGSNNYRSRLWKFELQKLSLVVSVIREPLIKIFYCQPKLIFKIEILILLFRAIYQ